MNRKHKLLSVTIGTTAFNEEGNIKNMLMSVIGQKTKRTKIKEILVISDGSTDRTVQIAKTIKDKRMKVFDDKKRMGQPTRIAQLLKIFKSDVLVIVDADMILRDKQTIENLLKDFHQDTALVCGATHPFPARTFLESAINNYIFAREALDEEFSFGSTAYGAHAFLAYSKKFAKSMTIPSDVLNTDAFSYFTCIANGLKTYYEKDAVALYRSPSRVLDHIHQSTRHLKGGNQLKTYFGKECIDKGFYAPRRIMLKILFYQLVRNPVGYLFLKMLNVYCGYQAKKSLENSNVQWTTIISSKAAIKNI